MKSYANLTAFILLSAACSTLPQPRPALGSSFPTEARKVLQISAAAHGHPWEKYRKVEVSYDGEWMKTATILQPIITNPEFRKSSYEIYQPKSGNVRQFHRGPLGEKLVTRVRPLGIEVNFNGATSYDTEVKKAAALVADAYTVFLFGPSWLLANGRDLSMQPEATCEGEICQLVSGRVKPGFGYASEDFFVAWVSKKSGLLRRFQFSLNGMDSTQGADVDVVFSDYRTAQDGSVWPQYFVERIQRPILAKAHVWRMTSLALDGQVVFPKQEVSFNKGMLHR